MGNVNNKFRVQPLVLNLHHHMRAFLWTKSKRNFSTQQFQPLVWFRYIDDIFFIWTHGENTLNYS